MATLRELSGGSVNFEAEVNEKRVSAGKDPVDYDRSGAEITAAGARRETNQTGDPSAGVIRGTQPGANPHRETGGSATVTPNPSNPPELPGKPDTTVETQTQQQAKSAVDTPANTGGPRALAAGGMTTTARDAARAPGVGLPTLGLVAVVVAVVMFVFDRVM